VEDVNAAVAEAKRRGIAVPQEPMESPTCVSAAILDPDGNAVGIHRRRDGTFG
jgi:predicted enzyme related to lactoylglutathione lyase